MSELALPARSGLPVLFYSPFLLPHPCSHPHPSSCSTSWVKRVCGRLEKWSPKMYVHILILGIYESYFIWQKRGASQVLRISGWGDCPAVSGWALSAVTCPYKREAEGEEKTRAVETAMMWPRQPGKAVPTRSWKRGGMDSPLEPGAGGGGKEGEALL